MTVSKSKKTKVGKPGFHKNHLLKKGGNIAGIAPNAKSGSEHPKRHGNHLCKKGGGITVPINKDLS